MSQDERHQGSFNVFVEFRSTRWRREAVNFEGAVRFRETQPFLKEYMDPNFLLRLFRSAAVSTKMDISLTMYHDGTVKFSSGDWSFDPSAMPPDCAWFIQAVASFYEKMVPEKIAAATPVVPKK